MLVDQDQPEYIIVSAARGHPKYLCQGGGSWVMGDRTLNMQNIRELVWDELLQNEINSEVHCFSCELSLHE